MLRRTDMENGMNTVVKMCAGSAVLMMLALAVAQNFSATERPSEAAMTSEPPKDQPAATPPPPPPLPPLPSTTPATTAPAAPTEDVHRVGGGESRFTLPLKLYDEKADAAVTIKRARDEAKKDNRRVLIMWGENKCEFCAYLNELLTTDPQIRQFIETEYVWVKVDIGKFDKNIDLARRYNTPIDDPGDQAAGRPSYGAPALTVVDPASDQAIVSAGGNAMVSKPMVPPNNVFNANYILSMLSGGRATPLVANMLMVEAQQKAKTQGKKTLVYFHIWASDSCKAWDRFINDPEGAAALGKAFIPRKIDVERHVAGDGLLKRLKGTAAASPPWATVLDAESKPAADAGKGLSFDPMSLDEAAKWLGDTGGALLTADDRAAIGRALERAAVVPAKK